MLTQRYSQLVWGKTLPMFIVPLELFNKQIHIYKIMSVNLLIVRCHLRWRIFSPGMVLNTRINNSHWHDIYIISWVQLCLGFRCCWGRCRHHIIWCTVLLFWIHLRHLHYSIKNIFFRKFIQTFLSFAFIKRSLWFALLTKP